MLYFVTKTRRDWNGALLSVSYYNQALGAFGAKCFASRLDFDEANQEKNYIVENLYDNPFITFALCEQDYDKYIMPPDKIVTKDYYDDEYMQDRDYFRKKMGRARRVPN